MYEFDLHRMRSAELRREAASERLARETARAVRAARREEAARHDGAGAETHTGRRRRLRLPRPA
ncbi:hypothetical protein ACGFYV_19310 [Streptomyces sp. NPDC048297]|uniref:hypothetical protein n=1 Tax=Streptomyces sp. NPDC048297 TaxID=3365531 RepID=UPI003714B11C